MKRYAIYARSPEETKAIEDQVSACEEYVATSGGEVFSIYTDISNLEEDKRNGKFRHGYQKLLEDLAQHKFDIVLAQDLNAISPKIGSIAYIYKLCQIHGIQLTTLAEGHIGDDHIKLDDTAANLCIKKPKKKKRRTKQQILEDRARGIK